MNKIDLIIDALLDTNSEWSYRKRSEALAAARELKELAQPEQKLNDPPAYVEPPTSDYHNGWEEGFEAAKNLFNKESAPQNADPRLLLVRKDNCIALAQPEQEEPLPLVDIGVDVTPEGTHVVACYNRPDAVQEMFYSQFHPLTKPEQEAVCDKDPFYCWSIRCQVGKVCKNAAQPEPKSISTNDHLCAMLRQVHDVLACTALPMKRKWVGLTDEEVNLIYAEPQTHVGQYAKAIEAKLKEKNNG